MQEQKLNCVIEFEDGRKCDTATAHLIEHNCGQYDFWYGVAQVVLDVPSVGNVEIVFSDGRTGVARIVAGKQSADYAEVKFIGLTSPLK